MTDESIIEGHIEARDEEYDAASDFTDDEIKMQADCEEITDAISGIAHRAWLDVKRAIKECNTRIDYGDGHGGLAMDAVIFTAQQDDDLACLLEALREFTGDGSTPLCRLGIDADVLDTVLRIAERAKTKESNNA